ncbi:hypothetical protein OG948_26895 [Embleya sp. NBC_00888]|uniref:hypothetical protein n=1 Tax=Embleya sp. NBC_00888 TaxID=2975960 RepID=UPI0038666DA5|nr:hypothetical protein OG948_26895 [Embleya sp. NBC_00888]
MALSPDSCGIVADFGTWLARAGRPARDAERMIDVLGTLLDLRVACLRLDDHTRWRAGDLNALLETLVPAHVALPRDDTVGLVVPALRLFLEFLRERGPLHPDSDRLDPMFAVLDRHEGELPARMADSTCWGSAKKLFVAGYATGPGRGRALPAVRLPDERELARAASTAPSFAAALTLARWVGRGRPVTATGVLRLAPAAEAALLLGIDEPVAGVRSARDVEPLHHVWSIACAAGLIEVGRTVATAGALARALAVGRPRDVLGVWSSLWEGVAVGEATGRPAVRRAGHVLRGGDVIRELLRELYDHAGRWVPMGGLFELLSYTPDGRPRSPSVADPALFTGLTLAHQMDDLRAFGVLEIRELVGGGAPFMAVRLTPLGLYGLRTRFLELGVPAPLTGPGGGPTEPALPPLYVPPTSECALAARMSPLLAQAAALAEYVAEHGPLPVTHEEVLADGVARRVMAELGIRAQPSRPAAPPRTARGEHALHRRWTLALGTGLLVLADDAVHVADGLRVWREGGDRELIALAARAMVVVAEDNATFGEAHEQRWDVPEGLAASLFTGLVQLGGPLPVSLFVGLAVRRDLDHVVRTLPAEPPADDEAFALGRILDAPDLVRELGRLCGAGAGAPAADASSPASALDGCPPATDSRTPAPATDSRMSAPAADASSPASAPAGDGYPPATDSRTPAPASASSSPAPDPPAVAPTTDPAASATDLPAVDALAPDPHMPATPLAPATPPATATAIVDRTPAELLGRVRAGVILLADRLAALGIVRRTAEGITLTGLGGTLVHRMFREQGLPVATVDDYTAASGARLLGAMGAWPRPVATRTFASWIACRPVDAALSELFAVAGAAGPTERLMLFAHVGDADLPEAAVERALAEAAADPTLAPHVWNWRLTHDHDVPPATLRTLAWLTADNAAAALLGRHEAAVLGLLTEVTGSQGPGADVVFGELATMGHPCAEDVLRFAEAAHPDPDVAKAARRALYRLR